MEPKLVAAKPKLAKTQGKVTTIKSGPYEGKEILIVGEYREKTGKSIFQSKSPAAFDYIKRMALEGFSPTDKVYLAENIDIHGSEIVINENELKAKKEDKPKQENKS